MHSLDMVGSSTGITTEALALVLNGEVIIYEGPQRHFHTPVPQPFHTALPSGGAEEERYGKCIPWQRDVEGLWKTGMKGVSLGSAVWKGCVEVSLWAFVIKGREAA
ncbi:hypothetical protein Bbelb_211230 [Branchiostoma belcheri]|nr:hypothetical protein Bbelb_211230 [Branchiostoma belcheri]